MTWTQTAELRGHTEEVRSAVRGCASGGGLILGASHSVCVGTKAENYLAALDELQKVGVYPL